MTPTLIPATLSDYPIIQSMWPFYVYDIGRYCGGIQGWKCPTDISFEPTDLSSYFNQSDRHAFLVNVQDKQVGFVLINKIGTTKNIDWTIGEFYISANFQGKSIGTQIAYQIWDQLPGVWEVPVIPENRMAIHFWRKTISHYTNQQFSEETKCISWDVHQPKRIIFQFDTVKCTKPSTSQLEIRYPIPLDIPAMVALSYQKRQSYELVNPQFWRASKNANEHQTDWFNSLLTHKDFTLLVARRQGIIVGFIIGQFLKAPEVYDPGGLTLQVDDFCIEATESWNTTGKALLEALNITAKNKGAVQIIVVCGQHDVSKQNFLKNQHLEVVSEWYFGKI